MQNRLNLFGAIDENDGIGLKRSSHALCPLDHG